MVIKKYIVFDSGVLQQMSFHYLRVEMQMNKYNGRGKAGTPKRIFKLEMSQIKSIYFLLFYNFSKARNQY